MLFRAKSILTAIAIANLMMGIHLNQAGAVETVPKVEVRFRIDSEDSIEPSNVLRCWQQSHVFLSSARFDKVGFNRNGAPVPGDMLLIYEGMKVSYDSNGEYQVDFLAECPPQQVAVRLQLDIVTPAGVGTLTLPTIRINEASDFNPRDIAVTISGRSEVLAQAARSCTPAVGAKGRTDDQIELLPLGVKSQSLTHVSMKSLTRTSQTAPGPCPTELPMPKFIRHGTARFGVQEFK